MHPSELEPPRPSESTRAQRLAAILSRWQWLVVSALGVLAVWLRVAPRFYTVFYPGFVNFQEGDAWYAVRVAENLVRHFPWRIEVDPFVAFGSVHNTATAPLFDWLLGLIAWVAGGGAPSESLLHQIAAWYPAVLGGLTIAAVFALGRLVFGLRAALIAAAVAATLPGHFLNVSSLGFTDHHILESLLATVYFFLLLRALERPQALLPAIAGGLTLAAYLLTFHGSAFLVGVVVAWAGYGQVRALWPQNAPPPSLRPLYLGFLVAGIICVLFRSDLWMNYTLAALAMGGLALGALELLRRRLRRFKPPRLLWICGSAGIAAIGLALVVMRIHAWRHATKLVLARFLPGLFGASYQITELQSLVFPKGRFTLAPLWEQYSGAYVFAVVGLALLAVLAVKQPNPGRTLVFFWGLTTFVLAIGQFRMTYYLAIAVALLTGYVADVFFASGRWLAALCGAYLVLLVLTPNLLAAANNDKPGGISSDWREALDWMRTSTPEPFGDPEFYYARYRRQQFGPDYRYPAAAYSVMAWWDYGYWIEAVARRIPVTNPTQTNARSAADFFLAQSEDEAIGLLQAWRTRYVVVDVRLPMWTNDDPVAGVYPAFFEFTPHHRLSDYFLAAQESDTGKMQIRLFYRPAYYRSMAIRLFVFGGHAADGDNGAVLVWLKQPSVSGRGHFPTVVRTQRFVSAQEAASAEAGCKSDGCVLVGDDPSRSCVPLVALHRFQPVFSSSSNVVTSGSTAPRAVQVYEVTHSTN